jgi:hypothetical protein
VNKTSSKLNLRPNAVVDGCLPRGAYPRGERTYNGVQVLHVYVDDHTERGVGGRQYGTPKEDNQALQG